MLITSRLTTAAAALLASMTLASAQMPQAVGPHPPARGGPMGGSMGGSPMMGGAMMSQGMAPGRHIEGRIAFLKAELGITEAQTPKWNAFADAMRAAGGVMRLAMAAHMPQAPGQPAQGPTTGQTPHEQPGHGVAEHMSAPARSDAMIAMMTARLESMKATSAAGKALYEVLTDAQKKTADELMMHGM